MNVFDAIDWAEINENDRVTTVINDSSQVFERKSVLGRSGESELSRYIYRLQCVSPIIRSAIASLAQLGFGDVHPEST